MSEPFDAEALLFGAGQAAPFLDEHWGKKWVQRRAAGDLGAIFSPADLATHAVTPLGPGQGGDTLHIRASYTDAEGRGRMFGGPLEMARQLLDLGMTLAFDGLQRTHPKLQALAAGVGKLVGSVGDVKINCFLSPEGSGLPWHIDVTHGLILQVSGEKRWLIGPLVPAPPLALQRDSENSAETAQLLEQIGYGYARPSDETATEIVMRPNDVLYLPPGQWHRANARGTSTHLSVIIRPFTFARLLRATISGMALKREAWRRDLGRDQLPALLDDARRELQKLTPQRLAIVLAALESSPLLRDILLSRTTETL